MLGWDRLEARSADADRPEPGLDRLPAPSCVEARPGRAYTHDWAGTDVAGGPPHTIGPCQRLARGSGEDMARQPRELLLAFAALPGRPGQGQHLLVCHKASEHTPAKITELVRASRQSATAMGAARGPGRTNDTAFRHGSCTMMSGKT